MIDVTALVKRFGARTVLDGLDLEVGCGEVVLLLGDNGTGKSTLLRCLLGLLPFEGRATVAGHDPRVHGEKVRQRVGYMPQIDGLHDDMSVVETLRLYGAIRDVAASDLRELLDRAGLDEAADHRVDEISGGMRQRLAFALALLGDPPLLLLDEPTASLDGWSRDALVESVLRLAAGGKTVVLATHASHPVLEGVARSVVLRHGRLGSPEPAAASVAR